MKTLSLEQPLIIMVVGLPGSGKSFFAQQFSETFNISSVSDDRIRAELFEKPEFTADENAIVDRMQSYMLEELVKTKRSFLVDGGSNTKSERQRLIQLAEKNGYGTLVIWVQTDVESARARATRPRENASKTGTIPGLAPYQFDRLSKLFAPPTREAYLVISGKHTYATQARTVLRKLAAPHAAKADTAHAQSKEKEPVKPRQAASRPRSVVIR